MRVIINAATIKNIADIQINASDCNTKVCITGYEKPDEEMIDKFIKNSNALGKSNLSYPELGMWALLLVYYQPRISIQEM